jgi:GGDEF domain-containing protein
MDKKGAEDAVLKLVRYSEEWHGDIVKELHIAIGYALSSENKGTGCEDLIKIADEQMYVSKEKYYLKTGRNRRRR